MIDQEDLTSLSKMCPEDLITEIIGLLETKKANNKTIAGLRKLVYTLSVNKQPSTGQPMPEEKFYEAMGWIEDTQNDNNKCQNPESNL